MNKHQTNDNPDTPHEKNSAWSEYARFHDKFIELLSYDSQGSFQKTNVWDYCYL